MSDSTEEGRKRGKWVYRPWITNSRGERIYPRPPLKVFRWWEDEEDEDDNS